MATTIFSTEDVINACEFQISGIERAREKAKKEMEDNCAEGIKQWESLGYFSRILTYKPEVTKMDYRMCEIMYCDQYKACKRILKLAKTTNCKIMRISDEDAENIFF